MHQDVTQSIADNSRTQRICLVILTVIVVGFALYFMRPVLLPLLFALFLYLCLTPLVKLQHERLRFPYALSLASTALIGTLVLLLVILIAASSVTQMAADLNTYQNQLNALVERISSAIPTEKIGGYEAKNYLQMSEGTISSFISGAVFEFSSLISNSVFVVILTVFILVGRPQTKSEGLLGSLELQVRRYISGTITLSLLTGLLVALTLLVLGVRYAMVFGLFAFLLNFIPLIGPVAATLLPLPIVLLSPDLSVTAKILAVAIPAVIEFFMGQIVSPRIIGRSLALHPVTVLLFLLFFQMIWGVGGAFMSTPIAAVTKILFEHFKATQPIAGLLAGDLNAVLDRD